MRAKGCFYSLQTTIWKPEACLQTRTAAIGKVYSQKSNQIIELNVSDTQDQTTSLPGQMRFFLEKENIYAANWDQAVKPNSFFLLKFMIWESFVAHCTPKTTLEQSTCGIMAAEATPTLLTRLYPLTKALPLAQQDGELTEGAKPDKTQQLFCQGDFQLPEHVHPCRVSQASAQAQGRTGTASSGKTGPHQVPVKLSWKHTVRTGTTWKRKLITSLVFQRQIDTRSETLARRYLFPFHKVKKTEKLGRKKKKKNQTKRKPTNK